MNSPETTPRWKNPEKRGTLPVLILSRPFERSIFSITQHKSPISLCEKQGFDNRTIIPPLGTAVHKQKGQDQNRYLGNSMMMYCQEILP